MNSLPQPNLVIIGAQKSGTTSLYNYLGSHPQIFMSTPVKEPGYFMKEEFVRRLFNRMGLPVASRKEALEQYMLDGYAGQRYFGEGSTFYTMDAYSQVHGVPRRMKQVNPGIKLIYILRNPLERIVSSYLHSRRAGRLDGGFRDFFDTHHYRRALQTSRYWHQLQPYLEHFPRRQVRIALFEDLVDRPEYIVDDLCAFLGLERAGGIRSHIRAFLGLERAGRIRPRITNQSENRSEFQPEDLLFPPTMYRRVLEAVLPDIEGLEAFLGRRLDVWDLDEDKWCAPGATHRVSAGAAPQ